MNHDPSKAVWDELRAAYRPAVPELDTGSIMAAIRREAAGYPAGRALVRGAAPFAAWACAAAASLALLAAAGALAWSIRSADQSIRDAWCQSVPPEEFEQNFLGAAGFTL